MISTIATALLTPASLAVVPPQAPVAQPDSYSHIAQARKSDFDVNQGTVTGTPSYVGRNYTIDDAQNWG